MFKKKILSILWVSTILLGSLSTHTLATTTQSVGLLKQQVWNLNFLPASINYTPKKPSLTKRTLKKIEKNYLMFKKSGDTQWMSIMKKLEKKIQKLKPESNRKDHMMMEKYNLYLSVIYLKNTDKNYNIFTKILDKKLENKSWDQRLSYLNDIVEKINLIISKIDKKDSKKNIVDFLYNIRMYAVYLWWENTWRLYNPNRIKITSSEEDKSFIEDKFTAIQKNLYTNIENSIKENELFKKMKYIQTWNIKWSYSIDSNSGTVSKNNKWSINIENYSIRTDIYDSEIKSEISWEIDNNWEELKYKMLFEYLTDWYAQYFKVSDLKIEWKTSSPTLWGMIDWLRKIAKMNSFVIKDKPNTLAGNAAKMIKGMFSWKIKSAFEKSWFEPYKVVWNKYYLIPARYICENIMSYSNQKCGESVYRDFIEDTSENIDIYYDSSKNHITIKSKNSKELKTAYIKIQLSKNEITGIDVDFTTVENYFTRIKFLDWKKLNLSYKDDYHHAYFKSELDSKNRFMKIDSKINILSNSKYNQVFSMSLNNKKLRWKFDFSPVSWKFEGSTDSENILDTFKSDIEINAIPENKITIKLNIKKNEWEFNLNAWAFWNIDLKYALENKQIKKLSFNSKVQYRPVWLLIDAKLDMNNWKIKWDANILMLAGTAKIDIDWTYDESKSKTETKLEIKSWKQEIKYEIKVSKSKDWENEKFDIEVEWKLASEDKDIWKIKADLSWDFKTKYWNPGKIELPKEFKIIR